MKQTQKSNHSFIDHTKWLEQGLRKQHRWYKWVWTSPNDFKIPIWKKIEYSVHGFTPNEYVWFDLEHNDYRDYISEYERRQSRIINGDYSLLLADKIVFEEMFGDYIRVPRLYAWVTNGYIYALHDEAINNDTVLKFLKEKNICVLKLKRGCEGNGVYVITYEENHFSANGKVLSDEEVSDLILNCGEAILSEYVKQSAFSASLYPHSTNTIRMICAKKKGEHSVRVIVAAQRIGNVESKPVDNVSKGALACKIDIQTGVLGPAVIAKNHNKCAGAERRTFDKHPDTGAQLEGLRIPKWDNLKDQMIHLTNRFPYLNLVAWDILLTDDGPCIIEGNATAGLMMFQATEGLRNKGIGDIYRSYGIIEKG